MQRDFIRLVQAGYDCSARDYLAWREAEPLLFRAELQDLAARLPIATAPSTRAAICSSSQGMPT